MRGHRSSVRKLNRLCRPLGFLLCLVEANCRRRIRERVPTLHRRRSARKRRATGTVTTDRRSVQTPSIAVCCVTASRRASAQRRIRRSSRSCLRTSRLMRGLRCFPRCSTPGSRRTRRGRSPRRCPIRPSPWEPPPWKHRSRWPAGRASSGAPFPSAKFAPRFRPSCSIPCNGSGPTASAART